MGVYKFKDGKVIKLGPIETNRERILNTDIGIISCNNILEKFENFKEKSERILLPQFYNTLKSMFINYNNIKVSFTLNNSDENMEFENLLEEINNSLADNIIIIYNTEKLLRATKYISGKVKNKNIVFTGSLIPLPVDPVEFTANFALAYGFISTKVKFKNVMVAMHGLVLPCNDIIQNDRFLFISKY